MHEMPMAANSHHPLDGLCILVTRPRHQAEGLCRLIEQAGGQVYRFPVLEIVPSQKLEQAGNLLHNLEGCRWIFFLSVNAVHFARKAYNGALHLPASLRVAAIGNATAKALGDANIRVDLAPREQFNSENLLAMPELREVAGQRCVIVRGEGGRELLAETLRSRGARVEFAEVYRRQMPRTDPSGLLERLRRRGIHAATVTSLEALRNLLRMAGEEGGKLLKETPLVAVSDRIKNEALERGFSRVEVAGNPADEDLVKTVGNLDLRGKSVARAD